MRKFIEDNKITFEKGNRNLSVITLIGYAQFLGLDKKSLEAELHKEITEDPFIKEEIDRLFNWAENKNYKSFWYKPEAKLQYIFE